MRLSEFITAPTRSVWKLRLLVYIAVIVTLSLAVQLIQVYLW